MGGTTIRDLTTHPTPVGVSMGGGSLVHDIPYAYYLCVVLHYSYACTYYVCTMVCTMYSMTMYQMYYCTV